MKNSMSQENLDEILSLGQDTLMSMVPFEHQRHGSGYSEIYKNYFQWYKVLMCLSKCDSNCYKRANKFGWNYDLSLRILAQLWIKQNGRCAVTGIIMSPESGDNDNKNPYRISVDRIDNYGGYTEDNIRLTTHWANNAKSTWPEDLFVEMIQSSSQLLKEERV